MPCYDASAEYDRKYRDAQAVKVEAVLCAVVTTFGLERVLGDIDLVTWGRQQRVEGCSWNILASTQKAPKV